MFKELEEGCPGLGYSCCDKLRDKKPFGKDRVYLPYIQALGTLCRWGKPVQQLEEPGGRS